MVVAFPISTLQNADATFYATKHQLPGAKSTRFVIADDSSQRHCASFRSGASITVRFGSLAARIRRGEVQRPVFVDGLVWLQHKLPNRRDRLYLVSKTSRPRQKGIKPQGDRPNAIFSHRSRGTPWLWALSLWMEESNWCLVGRASANYQQIEQNLLSDGPFQSRPLTRQGPPMQAAPIKLSQQARGSLPCHSECSEYVPVIQMLGVLTVPSVVPLQAPGLLP